MTNTDTATPCATPAPTAAPPAADAPALAPGGAAPLPWLKCVDCPELGRTCNGYDIAAIGTVEAVRTYH